MDLDGTIKYIPEEPRNFTFTSVISEHDSRLVDSMPVTDDHVDTPVETPSSILARFKSYNIFEKCNFSLYGRAIESLVRPDLRAEVAVQHSHVEIFKKLPSQIYLMMTLEVYHASFVYKMDNTATMIIPVVPVQRETWFPNSYQNL